MITIRSSFIACSFVLMPVLFSPPSQAANPYAIPEAVDEKLHTALQDLFNLRFEDAQKQLSEIARYEESHPLVTLANVVLQWWKLSVRVLEVDPIASEAFLDASEKCMEVAERHLDNDNTGEAHLAFGTTLSLMSRWSAANRAWFPAYTRGVRSSRYLERSLKNNPKAIDAYMALGTFNYARGLLQESLSQTVSEKEGKKTQAMGLSQLRRAYKDSIYFKHAAGLLLAGLLTNTNPQEALPILLSLRDDLPESGFVQMILITALYNLGEMEKMTEEIDLFFIKIEDKTVPVWFLPHAHFARGLISFRQSNWNDAVREFDKAIDSQDESNPYYTWAILYQGYALDAMGKRRAAKERYEKVLSLKRRFASHDNAKTRLGKPFKPTDIEMQRLEL